MKLKDNELYSLKCCFKLCQSLSVTAGAKLPQSIVIVSHLVETEIALQKAINFNRLRQIFFGTF